MTTTEYLSNFNRVSLSNLTAGFVYDADRPTEQTEKLSYILIQIILRCAELGITLDVEKLPYALLKDSIDLVLPDISITHNGIKVEVSSDGMATTKYNEQE